MWSEINCSSGAGVDSDNLPLLNFHSGKETHKNPGGAAAQIYTEKWIQGTEAGTIMNMEMGHPDPSSEKDLLPSGFVIAV